MKSQWFKSDEFRCRCGRPDCDAPTEPAQELVDRLDLLRQRLQRPVIISSGLRCIVWNSHEHGEFDSGHLDGTEVDIALPDLPVSLARSQTFDAIYAGGLWAGEARLFPRMGVGASFLHLGISKRLPSPRVWTYETGTKRSNSQ
jgi:hypothetical protein